MENKLSSGDESKEKPFIITKVRKSRVVLFVAVLSLLGVIALINSVFEREKTNLKPKKVIVLKHPEEHIDAIVNIPKSYADIKPILQDDLPPMLPMAADKKIDSVLNNKGVDQLPWDKKINITNGQAISKLPASVEQRANNAEDEETKARKSDITFSFKKIKTAGDESTTGTEKTISPIFLADEIQDPQSPYIIMTGTALPAVLITGINSDLPGTITAQIRSNIFDSVTGSFLLIPMGTKLIGRYDYKINWSQERVQVKWERLIFPNGSSITLGSGGMPGVDGEGYSGFNDEVNNHYGKLFPAILVSTFLSVGAEVGNVGQDPELGESVADGLTKDIDNTGQRILNRHLNIKPTIEIKQGFPFNVIVTKDIVLREYRS
jgi:type IV secretory pathway VirB10-like protein